MAQLAASAFNQLGQYANSPGHRAYCYAGLAVFFPSSSRPVTIASTHFAYPQKDDQAELAWVAWLNTEIVYSRMVTHLSTNLAQHRATSLICQTMLRQPNGGKEEEAGQTKNDSSSNSRELTKQWGQNSTSAWRHHPLSDGNVFHFHTSEIRHGNSECWHVILIYCSYIHCALVLGVQCHRPYATIHYVQPAYCAPTNRHHPQNFNHQSCITVYIVY